MRVVCGMYMYIIHILVFMCPFSACVFLACVWWCCVLIMSTVPLLKSLLFRFRFVLSVVSA